MNRHCKTCSRTSVFKHWVVYANWGIARLGRGPIRAAYDLHRYFEASDKRSYLSEVGPHIRAIATHGDLGAKADVIASCPALELISVYGVGYDAVDLDACKARGIAVTNPPDVLTDDCADPALGMWLALSRSIVAAEARARSGNWAAKGSFALHHRASGKRARVLGLTLMQKGLIDGMPLISFHKPFPWPQPPSASPLNAHGR